LVSPAGDGRFVLQHDPSKCVVLDSPEAQVGHKLQRGSCLSGSPFAFIREDDGVLMHLASHPGKCWTVNMKGKVGEVYVWDCVNKFRSHAEMKFVVPFGEATAAGPLLWMSRTNLCLDKRDTSVLQLLPCGDSRGSAATWYVPANQPTPKVHYAVDSSKCVGINAPPDASDFEVNGQKLILVDCSDPRVFLLDKFGTTATTTTATRTAHEARTTFPRAHHDVTSIPTTTETTTTTTTPTTTVTTVSQRPVGPWMPRFEFPLSFEYDTAGTCPLGWTCNGPRVQVCDVPTDISACNHPGLAGQEGKHYFTVGNDFDCGNATSQTFLLPLRIDRIAFRRSGGADDGSGLYVKRHGDDTVLCAADTTGNNSNAFIADFCTGLSRYAGTQVYIFLRDNQSKAWGKVLVDDIRLQDANGVDIDTRAGVEPASVATSTQRVPVDTGTTLPVTPDTTKSGYTWTFR